jgi:hypothetical protein
VGTYARSPSSSWQQIPLTQEISLRLGQFMAKDLQQAQVTNGLSLVGVH